MNTKDRVIPRGVLLPFILITSLFFLWGLANNMTDTLLAASKRIMSMTDSQTALIQISCYGLGYFIFAVPAAIYIKKYSYKSGILLGLMKFFKPGHLLTFASLLAIVLTMMVVFIGGQIGVYALVGISGCMSLMFPTIFGRAVKGLGEDTKIAGSGLIMTIVGGALITQLQGLVSTSVDKVSDSINLPAGINMAYLVPAVCFLIITLYSVKAANKHS